MKAMLALEDARERILAGIRPLPAERVNLTDAFGRFAAEQVLSPVDLPPADNSAMDGYALRAEDASSASSEAPVTLRLIGRAPAGAPFGGEVSRGECVRIFTGSVLPRGADAVVMQEDTALVAGDASRILILDKVRPWENVRFRGEDVKCGAILIEPGDKLSAARLGLLGAAGIGSLQCGRLPFAGIMATGCELRESGQALEPGAIFESNRVALAALASRVGAIPRIYGLVPDDLAATKAALRTAFDECDAVATNGGVSVGELDLVRAAFSEIGGQLEFWCIAIKPGKPFAFGRYQGKPLFGVPGNPVSAMVTFFLLATPALLRLQQARDTVLPAHQATLGEALNNPSDRRHFMRVRVDRDGTVRLAGGQASHILSAAATADGLVDVPPKSSFPQGTMVSVLRWD